MSSIPSSIYNCLEKVLLECGLFSNDDSLRAIFVDSRINAWCTSLREANNATDRVRLNVEYLCQQYNSDGENALALLLRVLSDHKPADDACHQKLARLADEIELLFVQGNLPQERSQKGFNLRDLLQKLLGHKKKGVNGDVITQEMEVSGQAENVFQIGKIDGNGTLKVEK